MKNMQQQYQEVPNVISGKDLDYLSDMFNWMYESYKKTMNQIPSVQDEVLKIIYRNVQHFLTQIYKMC